MSKTKHADHTMSPEEVAARRDDEDLFILDVRNEDDYEEWHIEGSYNLPVYDQLLEEDFTDLKPPSMRSRTTRRSLLCVSAA